MISISLILIGCKSKIIDDGAIVAAEKLYEDGITKLGQADYKQAAVDFEKVFFQHPGNRITPYAELMQAYSLYKAGEYEEAIDVINIFIKLHPRHIDIAYAYYLKSLASYVQITEVKLDQSRTEHALASLNEVIARFPKSKYAIDAELKIDLVKDHLAGKEMFVGHYYLKKRNPIAAIKRFQSVIEKYNTSSHTPEALYRLIESNLMLGLVSEAEKYGEVLSYNYQGSIWFDQGRNLLKKYNVTKASD